MCLEPSKYRIKTTFSLVMDAPETQQNNIKQYHQQSPQIHEKSSPEASKTELRKKHDSGNTQNNEKYREQIPKGDPWEPQGGPTNQGLSPFCSPGRPWEPKCLQDLSQGLPKPPQGHVFYDFGSIFGSKFDSLGRCWQVQG